METLNDFSLQKYASCKRLSNEQEKNYVKKFEKKFAVKEKNYGSIAIPLNSDTIKPSFSKRSLTETSGANLTGTKLRSDLAELPNPIPILEKLGITFNYVSGAASKQVIPGVVLNSPVADIKDGAVIGTLTDPEFSLEDNEVYLITSQLPLSRKFFIQINETTNELLKQIIYTVLQDALLYRVFYGKTAFGQCEGLYEKTGIEKASGASFTELVGYQHMRKVHSNQVPSESCVWVLNAALEEKLKARSYVNNGDRRIIQDNLLLDKPYILSERIAANQLWYGYFGSVVLTIYDLELLLDPFSTDGIVIKQWQPYSMSVRNQGWIKCLENVD